MEGRRKNVEKKELMRIGCHRGWKRLNFWNILFFLLFYSFLLESSTKIRLFFLRA